MSIKLVSEKKTDHGYQNEAYVPDSGKENPYDNIKDHAINLPGSVNGYNPKVNGYTDPATPGSSSYTDSNEGEKKKKEKEPQVGIFELFRFADKLDIFLLLFGILMACCLGVSLPIVIIIFGDMTDTFISDAAYQELLTEIETTCAGLTITPPQCDDFNDNRDTINGNPELLRPVLEELDLIDEYGWVIDGAGEDFIEQMNEMTINYIILGCCVIVFAYCTVVCFMTAAYRQGERIRTRLFWSILRQEIGWFDTHEVGELNTRLADDVSKIQEGIGDKLGSFFQYTAQFLGGFVVGFINGWELTLVIMAVSPLIMIAGGLMSQLASMFTQKELAAYAKAGAIAEEVLGAIRTVVAFGGEKKECARYNVDLVEARKFGIRKGMVTGGGSGFIYFIIFASYGLAFWYGAGLVRDSIRDGNQDYTAGTMLTVFYGVLMGAFAIGVAAPNIGYISAARGAAYTVYHIIDLEPSIDVSSPRGEKPDKIIGNIEFRNIHFRYPARPEIKILNGLNLTINVGQTVALVGSSGCGKSTAVQLIQRFYDPEGGEVYLDGTNLRDLNVKWLRRNIGVVSQEPILFARTIGENIAYGYEGKATQEQIENAAKNANAHTFISKLPKRYDTLVGERGAQLSGGQKQRIAIARAIIRNPKILLLDEATSALDTESEAIVQAALDKAREGRTTVVVAHRLSTIKTADVICGFNKGVIAEMGTHDELMEQEGIYHTLVMNQTRKEQEEKEQLEAGLKAATNDDEILPQDDPPPYERVDSRVSRKLSRGTSRTGSVLRSMSVVSNPYVNEEEEKLPDPQMSRIFKMNAPEWPWILCGCIGAIITGAMQPAFAFIFAEVITVFSELDLDKQKDDANLYSLMFVGIAIIQGLSMFFEGYFFGKSGEHLTLRLRELCFRTMLYQDISFFDDPKNSTGALCTRLSNDASAVQGATGARLGLVLRSAAALIGGLVIGLIHSWKLTLVFMAFAPFIVMSGFLEVTLMQGNAARDKEALEEAGKIAVECIENIRTVAQLTKEDDFYNMYCSQTAIPLKKNLVRVHIRGFAFAIAQSFVFFSMAGGFRYGAYLIDEEGLSTDDMFKVFGAVVFSAMMAGQVSSFAPDYGKAKDSASRIFQLLDREPLIDTSSPDGDKPANVQGTVDFDDVFFNYPTRPKVPILQGLSVSVSSGQMLALVGASGCGKSTSVGLMERFYDPKSGSVNLDHQNIRGLNVSWLRSQIGLVSQEPILFDATIGENIAYGDNSRVVPEAEIIEASKQANIHTFISSLPEGYDTNVGAKGTQLSGGQKQRIAIARALVRNPKILLLDEATSALDTESEKIVQEALDKAQEGRTSIVIAHRLSTIYNADRIAVIHNGQVKELGTHSELLALNGLYYNLNNIQKRKT